MKKYFLLLLVAGMTITATAQETTTEIPTKKHRVVTNGFWDNWFIDFGYDYLSAYSSQEHGMGVSGNPFSNKRGAHGFDVSIGKWATPAFGMRAKFQAAWARTVITPDITNPYPLYNHEILNKHPMHNLHNLFACYKPRVWNIIAYGSFGWLRNIDVESNSFLLGLGVLNQFNVTKRFHINVDIYANAGDPDMDGIGRWGSGASTPLFQSRDWLIGWSVGCGFNLGKVGWDNAPDVDAIMAMNKAQVDALNASLADSQAENDRQKPVTNVIAAPATTRASVFFNINKSKIASRKDLVNVKEIAEYAIANNRTVVVTGYADSNTGSAEYNQALSQRRAEAVAAELVKMGVSSDKIETAAKGGVNDLDPFSYNRRATVTLK